MPETQKAVSLNQVPQGSIKHIEVAFSKLFVHIVIEDICLIRVLKEGTFAGASLDVFKDEPIKPDNPLLRLENVVLTEKFPKTAIDIFIEVLQADGGTRCAGITAAAVALADAGIPNQKSTIKDQQSTSPRGIRQTAYRIVVASSEGLLKKDQGDLWDSGRVTSDESVNVAYAGKPLESDREITEE
jgi:hypothetical protein